MDDAESALKSTIFESVPPPGTAESVGLYVPVIGWFAASCLWNKRHIGLRSQIREKIDARKDSELRLPEDALASHVFAVMCHRASTTVGWKRERFSLDDDIAVMFWTPDFGMDDVEAIMDVEDDLGLKIATIDVEYWFKKTAGELVDFLCAEIEAQGAKVKYIKHESDDANQGWFSDYLRQWHEGIDTKFGAEHQSFRLTRKQKSRK